MRQNEKGFTYPVVLMLIVLFCLYLSFQIQFYLSEKRLYQESTYILKQEYYMHTTVKRVEKLLQNNLVTVGTGQFVFNTNSANYRIEVYSTNLLKVTITIKLNTLIEVTSYAYYDKNLKKMIKWVERN
jgi:hypothetical protein